MKVKEESEKVVLKLNIQKTKIMASGPIISWQIDGETVADFIFLGSKIAADSDCSHEIKRCLLLGRKVMNNLDSILKNRDITLPTKICLVKAMVFPVVMYGCESWTIKKAKCQRIDAFELWCWRRLLRVPWTARGSNQSILKEISPGCSLGGLMLKLKLQYFGHLMRRVDSFEKTLMLGKTEGRRRRGWQRMRWLDGITDSMDLGFGWTPGVRDGQGGLACCASWGLKESDVTEQLNWTELRVFIWCFSYFLWYACIAVNLPLGTAFTEFHRFGVVLFSLSFVSMYITCLISSVICWLFSCVLFSFHMFVLFTVFPPCSWCLILLHCDQKRCLKGFQFFFFLIYWG